MDEDEGYLGEGSSPSPIKDEGWIGPGGRKVLALVLPLLVIAALGALVSGGLDEIRGAFDDLSEPDEPAVTLEDTTIDSGTFPPAPEPPIRAAPRSPEEQFERAQRQLDCISRAPTAEAMARCVQSP